MKRLLSSFVVLLLILVFQAPGAHAMCQICYEQSFLGIHYTTWDTLPDSCSDYILLSSSARCLQLLKGAPAAPAKYESVFTWLDGSGILDSLTTGELILSTQNNGQVVVRPVSGQPGQLEYATIPNSPFAPNAGPVIIGAVRVGRPFFYPPIQPIAGGQGQTCGGGVGTDFCLDYTLLNPSTHQVSANQMYSVDIQSLTFHNVATVVPTLNAGGLAVLVFLLIGVGAVVMVRRSRLATA